MQNLISKIKQNVVYDYSFNNAKNVLDYKELAYEKELTITNADDSVTTTNEQIWTNAIQKALDENDCVYIPKMEQRIFIDNSIFLHSNNKLKVDVGQEIVLTPDTDVCMVRNENIIGGAQKHLQLDNPDCNIVVEGGIWNALSFHDQPDSEVVITDDDVFTNVYSGKGRLRADKENSITGVFAIMLFSNIKNLIVKNVTMANSLSYGVQLSNCESVFIENILFENYHKDGIHVNGPAKYVHLNELSGKNMGDDLVALNAWDWSTSAMSFGTIEYTLVENVHSVHSEMRLLPGRKVYDDGNRADCDIRNCMVQNVEGVYTYKMYAQPYFVDTRDCSETVGVMDNIYMHNISFPEITGGGLNGVSVGGLFEVCADTNNLHFDNITIKNSADDFKKLGIPMIKVGPLSETFKFGSEKPEKWREIMSPDDICTAKNTYIGNVSFTDYATTKADADMLIRATKQTINEDYPNTLPKGGTGYGTVENVIFEG